MKNTAIIYYTNNLLPKALFEFTLKEVIKHSEENDCEAIMISHFPVLINHEKNEDLLEGNEIYQNDFDKDTGKTKKSEIYNYIVKDIRIENKNAKNYVVGKLPYSWESIFKQILLSLEKTNADNIILMEHDCLYPSNYIENVEKLLNQFDFTYCSQNHSFLNPNGFFNLESDVFVLSGCSGKKELWKRVLNKKIELINNKKPFFFEPILDIEPSVKKEKYPEEIIINKHVCMDHFLGAGHSILDIKHSLNSDGMLLGNYYDQHEYWGEAKRYTKLLNDISDSKWNYGVAKLNY